MQELFDWARSVEARLEALKDSYDVDTDPFADDNGVDAFTKWMEDVDARLEELESGVEQLAEKN